MDVVALVVSIIALLASGASAWYARHQARIAEGALELERQRERARNRPQVDVRFVEWLSEPLVATLGVENRSARTIDRVTLEALDGDPKLVGSAKDETQIRIRKHKFGPLSPGGVDSTEFVLIDRAWFGHRVRFFATFRSDDDEWDDLLHVPLPPPGPRIW